MWPLPRSILVKRGILYSVHSSSSYRPTFVVGFYEEEKKNTNTFVRILAGTSNEMIKLSFWPAKLFDRVRRNESGVDFFSFFFSTNMHAFVKEKKMSSNICRYRNYTTRRNINQCCRTCVWNKLYRKKIWRILRISNTSKTVVVSTVTFLLDTARRSLKNKSFSIKLGNNKYRTYKTQPWFRGSQSTPRDLFNNPWILRVNRIS